MIAYIKGSLEEINEQSIVVEANGVGYEILCSNPFAFQDKMEQTIRIHTYHYVREDTQVLYGFKHVDEKVLFSKLLNVSGIGPKGALSVLGTAGVKEFVVAIEEENEKFLTGFPGVGKKTARQMILDLKGKLPFTYHLSGNQEDNNQTSNTAESIQALAEAFEALKSLGYSEREIKHITPELKKQNYTTADAFIRKGLALMTKK